MDLLALLKWKAYPDRVMDILGRLRHVSGEEIVKVLSQLYCWCKCKLVIVIDYFGGSKLKEDFL